MQRDGTGVRTSLVDKLGGAQQVFWAVLVFGALIRIVLLYTTRDMRLAISDEVDYYKLAYNLFQGHGLAWGTQRPTSIRPPLYPAFLSTLWYLYGTPNIILARSVQILISLATVYVLYRLATLVFHQGVARVAAACFWLYPSLLAFNFFLLTEVIFTFFLTLLALCYVYLLKTGRPGHAFLTGSVLGLSALTRSVLWPFPFLLCPLTFFLFPGHWRQRLSLALCLFLGYALVIGPWAYRNTRLQGVFTVVDTMGGLNMWMGNYAHTPFHRAWAAIDLQGDKAWHYELVQEHPEAYTWTEGRKEKWALQKAFAFMQAYPLLTCQRALVKFINFWGLERVVYAGWQHGFYAPPLWFKIVGTIAIGITYVLTALYATLGLFLALPKERRAHVFFVLLIVFICGLHTLTFGHERYRLPLIPLLLLYATAAWQARSWRRYREGLKIIGPPILVSMLFIVIWCYEIFFVETTKAPAYWHSLF